MEDYGYYRKKKRDKPHRSWWGMLLRIVDIIMLVGTILCSALLILAFFAKYIDPSKGAVFAFAGLIFPVAYIAEVIFALYWTMRWRRYAVFAAVILIFGIWNTRLFYRTDIRERYQEDKPLRSELVVMSYNVMHFSYKHADKAMRPVEHIAGFVKDNNVDILCMQEFNNVPDVRNVMDSVLSDLKYVYFKHYTVSRTDGGEQGPGLAIYSRYPIINKGIVEAEPAMSRSMWADIKIKRDTVRVINNHLQSTYINDNDVDYLSSLHVVSEPQGRKQLRQIIRKLKESYIKRAPQARNIAGFVGRSPYPTIVCGDLNDTPVSYAYRTVSRGLTDSFVAEGKGSAGTYSGFFNMFRIDYIFMSDELEVVNYYPYDVLYSDHNPVAASFYFTKP